MKSCTNAYKIAVDLVSSSNPTHAAPFAAVPTTVGVLDVWMKIQKYSILFTINQYNPTHQMQ
jgi:hypothetical protein